jgi:hypothetical protein
VTAHCHAWKKEVVPGDLYVAKSATTAFKTPSITSSVIGSDVLTDWRALSLSLHNWYKIFFIATNASDDDLHLRAMEVQETFFRTKALNFKALAKCKRTLDKETSPSLSLQDVSTYYAFFKDDEESPIINILGSIKESQRITKQLSI